jgi:hypothetical protein
MGARSRGRGAEARAWGKGEGWEARGRSPPGRGGLSGHQVLVGEGMGASKRKCYGCAEESKKSGVREPHFWTACLKCLECLNAWSA